MRCGRKLLERAQCQRPTSVLDAFHYPPLSKGFRDCRYCRWNCQLLLQTIRLMCSSAYGQIAASPDAHSPEQTFVDQRLSPVRALVPWCCSSKSALVLKADTMQVTANVREGRLC